MKSRRHSRFPKLNFSFLTRRFTHRQVWVMGVAIVVLLLLQGSLWLSRASVPALITLQHQNHRLAAQNGKLTKRNQAIYRKITVLRNSNQAVESIARSQFGLIQKGEQYYFVVYRKKKVYP